jgi:type II secretory pathway pseudopilin PulG
MELKPERLRADSARMALRLISLLVSLVLMAFLAVALLPKLTKSDNDSAAGPQNLLRTAALVVERTHQLTGSYQGIGVQDQDGLRLAQADANGYCLELSWVDKTVWHLRGPGAQAEQGAC